MFVVEWLKADSLVHRQAMLGASLEDVLKAALAGLPKIAADRRLQPDAIRIHDASRNETTIHRIGAPDGKGA
jgi:hypothetical protein